MNKSVLVILAPGFEEIEAVTTIGILRRAHLEITIAGLSDIKIASSRKITITADKLLFDVNENYDALALPGGMPGAANLAASAHVKSIIAKMDKEKKLIAAICAAPAKVLAPLGVLNNKQATCFPGMESSFDKSTTYKEKTVVIDKNILTASGPGQAFDFALTILHQLTDLETSKTIREKLLK